MHQDGRHVFSNWNDYSMTNASSLVTGATADDAPRLELLKSEFAVRFAAEHATTMRVLRAVPDSGSNFRPHPRSASALELAATLDREQTGIVSVLNRTWSMPPSFPTPAESWANALQRIEAGGAAVVAALRAIPATRLGDAVPFFTGPGTVAPVAIREMLWFWLLDMIHHRGQLSVYVRMAGGRVPAIYGPSADETWS